MRSWLFQSNFNSGVLDPRLAGRLDVAAYYKGLKTGENVVTLPQGGVRRRGGLAYIATLPAGKNYLAPFSFSVTQDYLLVLSASNIAVYHDEVKVADVAAPWSADELAELYYTQSADTMILTHPDHAPRRLTRGSSHASWTLDLLPLSNIPQFAYGDSLSPAGVNEVQRITFAGAWDSTANDSFQLVLDGVTSAAIAYHPTASIQASNIQTALRALSNTSTDGITVASASATEFDVTFGGDDGEKNWQTLTPTNVKSASGSLSVTTTTQGVATTEDIWSTTRGWPRTVTFHEGRLWLGGSKSKPQALWGSVTNDFYNFDTGDGLPDEAIFVNLDTDQVNAINGLFAGRHLQIFTGGGEFYIPSAPITPEDCVVKRQSLFGASQVRPVSIDGATLFVDRNGKALREYLYSVVEESYTAGAGSLFAPHLIKTPVSVAAQRGNRSDDVNFVYLVNTDGTAAVYNSLREQEVAGWSSWSTQGSFENVAVLDGTVYFVVKRTVGGADVRYLERLDADYYTDAAVQQSNATPSDTVTGLAHLNGLECRVRADRSLLANVTPASGSATIERAADEVEVGLFFEPTITTMPLNMNAQNGPTLPRKKRIVRVTLDLHESLAVLVNDVRIPDRQFDVSTLDSTPEAYTALRTVRLSGWGELATVTITQDGPQPLTVLGIAVEVEGR